jgi:hypothetical protein
VLEENKQKDENFVELEAVIEQLKDKIAHK